MNIHYISPNWVKNINRRYISLTETDHLILPKRQFKKDTFLFSISENLQEYQNPRAMILEGPCITHSFFRKVI